ncbi:hypothetical protein [Streptomyces sp. NBC_00989]|uniref:hypothetical protein n=1 Tax=Streptomyces sp. NBC_00989 TaxID=2903705 RepID=UPI00386D62AC|nr:hypothetical protein OG714_04875 [Streptomyces sp. NBC_00989]
MRSHTGVFVGNLVFIAVCLSAAPFFLLVGYFGWSDHPGWDWPAMMIALGLGGTVMIPVVAITATRQGYPRITRRDRVKGGTSRCPDDTFVMWAPRSQQGPARARLVRADVLEASLARYNPDGESTFTTHYGDYTPDEFTPLIRLRLRVRDAEETDGTAGFEVTGEWRVPSLCLSAITAGRLVVLVDDLATPGARRTVTPDWSRSNLLAGTRTCRVIDLEGRTTDVTGRVDRQLGQMRISREVGAVAMNGDTIDLRRLDPHTAARYAALADRDRALPEERAPVSEPGEEARRLADQLPGERAAFGSVGRRWSRRGGALALGRFLEMRARTTFQDHGPVLDTVLRVQPADGTPPFDATRRLTVPMDYLTVLHRTKEVVLVASPNGVSYDVDWARTSLLAGITAAKVITPDGRELLLTERPDTVWALMNLLASHGLSNPSPVLDLRKSRMRAAAGILMDVCA